MLFYFLGIVFVVGYLFITLEHWTKINKAAVSLLMAALSWILILGYQKGGEEIGYHFLEHLAATSQIVLFLLGAMTIVEIIQVHDGFSTISDLIKVRSKRGLLWIFGCIAFFLSSVIDNLTATIVMISLLRQICEEREDRLIFGGIIVIAANAGGAWTPIGDVTTTMLWIGGQISTYEVMRSLFLPSMLCLLIPLWWMARQFDKTDAFSQAVRPIERGPYSRFIFFLGVGALFFVPILKMATGLPPFMGVLLGLAFLWTVTDCLHHAAVDVFDKKVETALARIDHSTVLFFLGILLTVQALDTAGVLSYLAHQLNQFTHSEYLIATMIGLISAVIDNVPLVAGAMGMYGLSTYPMDAPFWQLIAYCAGTGGSLLIIGSAAGVAFMGMERVDFVWYMRYVTFPAALGYFAGIVLFLCMHGL